MRAVTCGDSFAREFEDAREIGEADVFELGLIANQDLREVGTRTLRS